MSLETIQASLSDADIFEAVKGALIAQAREDVNALPPGMLQLQDPAGECHIKYGHLKGSDTFVIKIACGFYENPKMGLPASSGMMVVFNAETGRPAPPLLRARQVHRRARLQPPRGPEVLRGADRLRGPPEGIESPAPPPIPWPPQSAVPRPPCHLPAGLPMPPPSHLHKFLN